MHHPMHRRFFLQNAVAVAAVIALALTLVLPTQAAGLCSAPWVHDDSRMHLDGNGKAPMIVEFTLHDVSHDMQDDCETGLYVYAKSGLVVLSGRPIETVQEHQLLMDEAGVVTRVININGRVLAQSGHIDLVGTMSTAISSIFLYGAGLAPEAQMLPGDTYESSFGFDMVSPRLEISVGHIRAERAKVEISEREVGPPRPMNAVVDQLQCRPVRYTRTARLEVLQLGNETLEPDPTVVHTTGWYCPEAVVVIRQEIEQHGQTQMIDMVELKHQTYRVQC